MISVHWIPTHRGPEDKDRFAHWKPPFVKIVCVDEKPPYTQDLPASSMIIIRNHPMSELYGTRGLAAAAGVGEGEDITAKYEAYFSAFFHQAPAGVYREGFKTATVPPAGRDFAAAALATPEQAGAEHAAACQRMASTARARALPAPACCLRASTSLSCGPMSRRTSPLATTKRF